MSHKGFLYVVDVLATIAVTMNLADKKFLEAIMCFLCALVLTIIWGWLE